MLGIEATGTVDAAPAASSPSDTLQATRVHGVVRFTGMLSNQWMVPDFYPIDDLPRGVRLTAHTGDATDLPHPCSQTHLDDVTAGRAPVPLDRVYDLDHIQQAHARLESRHARGKLWSIVASSAALSMTTILSWSPRRITYATRAPLMIPPSGRSLSGRDVLVDVEDVLRIEPALDRDEAGVRLGSEGRLRVQ